MAFFDWFPWGPLAQPFVRRERKKREAFEKKVRNQGREQKAENKKERRLYEKERKEFKKERAFEKKQFLEQKKLFGKAFKKYGGEKFMQKPALNKEQQNLLDYLSKYGRGRTDLRGALKEAPLYKAGEKTLLDLFKTTPSAYEDFKRPIMKEFQRDILPMISARSPGGSALQNALSGAASDLGERLGTLRAQLRQQGISQALGYAQQPIANQLSAAGTALGTDPFINIYRPPTIPGMPASPAIAIPQRPPAAVQIPPTPPAPGFFGNLTNALGPALGVGAGYALGGPIGGALGGALGGMFNRQQPAYQPAAQPFNAAMPQRQQMPGFGQFEQQRRFGGMPFMR